MYLGGKATELAPSRLASVCENQTVVAYGCDQMESLAAQARPHSDFSYINDPSLDFMFSTGQNLVLDTSFEECANTAEATTTASGDMFSETTVKPQVGVIRVSVGKDQDLYPPSPNGMHSTSSNDTRPGPSLGNKYERLISLTLLARREARHWQKLAAYWEHRARTGEAQLRGAKATDIVTPSSSDMPHAVSESLSPERANAVDSLLRQRRVVKEQETKAIRESMFERIGETMQTGLGLSDSTCLGSAISLSLSTSTMHISVSQGGSHWIRATDSSYEGTIPNPASSVLPLARPCIQSRASADVKSTQRRRISWLRTSATKHHDPLGEKRVQPVSRLPVLLRGVLSKKSGHVQHPSRDRLKVPQKLRNLASVAQREQLSSPPTNSTGATGGSSQNSLTTKTASMPTSETATGYSGPIKVPSTRSRCQTGNMATRLK